MKHWKVIFLGLVVSCTPRTPPAPKPDEFFSTLTTLSGTMVRLNTVQFPDCPSYQVIFNNINLGYFIIDDIIHLPLTSDGSKTGMEVKCTTNEGAHTSKFFEVVRSPR